MGLSLLELCALLQEIGRAVAPVPVLASLVLAGLPIARAGTHAQRERWLPALARGERSSRRRWSTRAPPIRPRPPRARGARARASCSTARSAACRSRAPRSSCSCRPRPTRARASSWSIRARAGVRVAKRLISGRRAALQSRSWRARRRRTCSAARTPTRASCCAGWTTSRSSRSPRRRSVSPSARSRSPPTT